MLAEQLKSASDVDSLDFYRAAELGPEPVYVSLSTRYGDVAGPVPS